MKLSEQIAQFKAGRTLPDEYAGIMKRGREQIRDSGAAGLAVGERVPDFTLPNQVGKMVRLDERLAAGPVVLSFYRGVW